ncbi:MAG: cytochrome c biogenesis protein ResB [Actinobacteria bacterium]|nr:cytochrome c biogenesis protein ResB [Actinomycetota bacterium]
MRTAIILLLLLAAAASLGSLFPQRPIDPAKVALYINHHPAWGNVALHLGLFDVFGAWWFMAIYALLLVSLIGCLIPRYRAFFRVLRSKPREASTLQGQQRYTSGTVRATPDEVLARAQGVLKGRRFRLARGDGSVSAEKGNWREGGSLIFHTAFLVLLIGVSVGKAFGFSGQAVLVEGDSFTDTHLDYDTIVEGRLFDDHHRGFTIREDAFDVGWYPNGTPRFFRSHITLFDHGRQIGAKVIEVNKPLTYRGVKVYQLSWGWAPSIRVAQDGTTLYDGPTVFLPQLAKGTSVWHGVIKVPQTKPQQVGLDMFFYADPVIGSDDVPVDVSPDARNPLVVMQRYQGDLGLRVPQSVYSLDMRGLVAVGDPVPVVPGQSVRLGDGITVTFDGLKKYSIFEIASNPGAPWLLAAAILILVGLIPALYSSRRRVWVRAVAAAEGSRLEIAGHALQRKAAFEEEFRALVRELDEELYESARARGDERVGARDG